MPLAWLQFKDCQMLFRTILRSAIFALALSFADPAGAVGVLSLSGSQQFDKDASPPSYLTGGNLYIYNAGTTTPATVYSDSTLMTPLASPIVLNTAGRIPPVYGADGLSVRVRLLSSVGVLQFDDDAIPLVVAPVSSTPVVVTADQLWAFADVKVRFDDQPVSGYVRCNGRTIGSATSGAAERANADVESLFKFLWTFANVSVVTGKGATASADWSANKQLTLPDCSGRMIAGLDDLGGGAKSRITSATVAGPTVAGATGGTETVTLDATMIPAHTHPSPTITNPTHQHFVANTDVANNVTVTLSDSNTLESGNVNSTTSTNYVLAGSGTTATIGLTSATTAGQTLGANTGSTGGGLAHRNMPPVMLFTIYLKL